MLAKSENENELLSESSANKQKAVQFLNALEFLLEKELLQRKVGAPTKRRRGCRIKKKKLPRPWKKCPEAGNLSLTEARLRKLFWSIWR